MSKHIDWNTRIHPQENSNEVWYDLPNGKILKVDAEDQHLVYGIAANDSHVCVQSKIGSSCIQHLLHRLITNCPDGKDVDHIFHDVYDNRKKNLRVCEPKENQRNKLPRAGKMKGVTRLTNGKWQSQIKQRPKNFFLGNFESAIDAALAYDKKARELFGEFANTNFTYPQVDGPMVQVPITQ